MSELDKIDFSFGDGDLTFTRKGEDEPATEEQPQEEPQQEADEPQGIEKALRDTQAWGHQLAVDKAQLEKRLKELEEKVSAGEKADESLIPEGMTLADVLSDEAQGIQFLTKLVQVEAQRLLNEQFAEVAPVIQEYNLTRELRDTAQRYGKPFVELIENGTITKIIEWHEKTYPGQPPLTFEQAYFLARQSAEKRGTQPQSGTGGSRPQSPNNVQATIDRARKLTTERGIASSGQKSEERVTTVDAALEKALEEMFA